MAVTARKRDEPRAQGGGLGQFLREVIDELRKVVWPTPGELYRYTLVVIFTVVLLGIFIGGTDYFLSEAAKRTLYNNGVH
jgi:preprotein translocase subunit SecE